MFMGIETEYAVSGRDRDGGRVSQATLCEGLMAAARQRLVYLPDGTPHGMFVSNGSRFYLDYGMHPEWSTCECSEPAELVRYVRAGDEILRVLADDARDRLSLAEVGVYRGNVDYSGSGATWASHESLLYRSDPRAMGPQIVPHLASRILFCGSGGFGNLSEAQLQFTLSPRAFHIVRTSSGDSTHDRGLWHRKNEPLGIGYNRLHLLTGESLCSDLATYLRIGTTALIVALVDLGDAPGEAVQLRSPVVALRTFAGDPHGVRQARLFDGRRVSALDIQRHYLAAAERRIGHAEMPAFAEAVCRRWREVLDLVEQGPHAVADRLDWAVKWQLYGRQIERAGLDWEKVGAWNRFLNRVFGAGTNPVTLEREPDLGTEARLRRVRRWIAAHAGTDARSTPPGSLDELAELFALRQRLFELDTRFAQLGSEGIFNALDCAGLLAHRLAEAGRVAEAVDYPPERGRARARGEAILRCAGNADRYLAEWHGIYDHQDDSWLDLKDPYRSDGVWQGPPTERRRSVEDFLRRSLRRLLPSET